MRVVPIAKLSSCLLLVVLSAAALNAQAPAAAQKTATQFYMEYRAAFDKAKKIEEVLPYMAAANRKEVESTPPAERVKMFEMVKAFNVVTNVKVLKEERTANGATLSVEGIDEDKKKATGTVRIIREGGAWKLEGESWKTSS
jgi:hypothetical protein